MAQAYREQSSAWYAVGSIVRQRRASLRRQIGGVAQRTIASGAWRERRRPSCGRGGVRGALRAGPCRRTRES